MLVTKKYIFHYDKKQPSSNNTKYLEHDGQECTAYFYRNGEDIEEPAVLDVVHVIFTDGFHANAYAYELEEIN